MSQSEECRNGAQAPATAIADSYRLTLDGKDHTVPIAAGETLLQAALAAGIDAPHTCTLGRCGACMSWLRNGDVSMAVSRALSPRNRERGYVLACQATPTSNAPIWLDYDLRKTPPADKARSAGAGRVKPRKPQNVALIAVSHGWHGL